MLRPKIYIWVGTNFSVFVMYLQTSQPGETAHSEISFSWAAGRLASPYRCHNQIPLLPFLPSQENTEENNDCKVKRPGPEQTECKLLN